MKKLLSVFTLLLMMTTLYGQGRGMNAISTAGSTIETKGLVNSWTISEDLIDFPIECKLSFLTLRGHCVRCLKDE